MPITVRNVQGMPVRLHLLAENGSTIILQAGKDHQLPIDKPTPEIQALIGKKVLRLLASTKVAEVKPPARPASKPAPPPAAKESEDKQSDNEE